MIALDTDLVVYAHREDSPHHARARKALETAVGVRGGCAIAWPCLHEFLAVVTHPRIYAPPTPVPVASTLTPAHPSGVARPVRHAPPRPRTRDR